MLTNGYRSVLPASAVQLFPLLSPANFLEELRVLKPVRVSITLQHLAPPNVQNLEHIAWKQRVTLS